MISPQIALGDDCDAHTAGVSRLDIPQWMWLTETNTGVTSACLAENKCSTNFPSPQNLAASFNRSLWFLKGRVISTELRAYSNINWHRNVGPKELHSVTGYGPNINLNRDPRFGRNSEIPSEDPVLAGEYAVEFVRGCQEPDRNGHPRMLALLKHFTAYSSEENRGHSNFAITEFDLFDSYLEQYRRAFTKAQPAGLMCSYNAIDGHPSCANGRLLDLVIRGKWNQRDALVTTDCGAVNNLRGAPVNASSDLMAAAIALNNGTDIEMGSLLWANNLEHAVRVGATTEDAVDAALRRQLLVLMKSGRFDPVNHTEWVSLTAEDVNSTLHQKINYEAALQSFVLLKNDGLLPLKEGANIAVLGPQAVAQVGIFSDYSNSCECYGCDYSCVETIGEGITRRNKGGQTWVEKAVDINSTDSSNLTRAIKLAQAADVAIVVVGTDRSIESEGKDRPYIHLPGLQENLVKAVVESGTPTVLVMVHGGALGIDDLVDGVGAIVDAFYPSRYGATALAETLFGDENRWGRLPVTIYPNAYIDIQEMSNYNMTTYPGRSYRYLQIEPVFPFGAGLSYTSYSFGEPQLRVQLPAIEVSGNVTNDGHQDGDAILLVYHEPSTEIRSNLDHPVPAKRLIAFERVRLQVGETQRIKMKLDVEDLAVTTNTGDKVVYSGIHKLILDIGDASSPVEVFVSIPF
mmetsp:Transcript_30025/g.73115  ORF Transcript_30025/g.73115 Transcript_30025/m.73115 type:complete len:688 (+) Transcript_30025:267-2330(+)